MYSVVLMMAMTGSPTETIGLFKKGDWACSAGYSSGQHVACYGYSLNCIAVYHGCYGGYPTYGATSVSPYFYLPPAPPKTENKPTTGTKPGTDAARSVPGEILVSLPADARLSADGKPTRLTTPVRRFVTPALVPGHDYHYTLQMDVVRNGRDVSESRRITVRAGETTRVEFAEPTLSVAKRD